MKKLTLICLSALMMAGCADKNEYSEAVLQQMKADKDIKDYKIDPEYMTDCVVDLTSKNMPGMFPFDPDRLMAYRNYAKMLTLHNSKDPNKTLDELRKSFGSPQALADAHRNYAESMMNCMSAIVMESEEEEKAKSEQKTEETAQEATQPELQVETQQSTESTETGNTGKTVQAEGESGEQAKVQEKADTASPAE